MKLRSVGRSAWKAVAVAVLAPVTVLGLAACGSSGDSSAGGGDGSGGVVYGNACVKKLGDKPDAKVVPLYGSTLDLTISHLGEEVALNDSQRSEVRESIKALDNEHRRFGGNSKPSIGKDYDSLGAIVTKDSACAMFGDSPNDWSAQRADQPDYQDGDVPAYLQKTVN